MTIDSRGIESNHGMYNASIRGGILTSSESFLRFRYSGSEYASIELDLVISDSKHSVGLRVEGHDRAHSGLYLMGNQSNTFTGNVEVSGWKKHLVLRKDNGAIAVRSDILVKENAILRFEGSNQLLKTSKVKLKTHGVLQTLAGQGGDITNTFLNITVEDNGVVHFNHGEGNSLNSKYYIKIDDLIINQSGHLEIHGWQESRDFLLVRKTSAALEDALTKMTFAGYDRNNIHLEEYDSEYWSISSTPEPTTYGALLGAIGLGLWAWKRKRREMPRAPRGQIAAVTPSDDASASASPK